eukprot:5932766-Alexandrium_andersonii.AAC.1
MSASLVGSEMCIRDRLVVAGALAPSSSAAAALRGGGAGGMLLSSGLFRSCLLYTSDAADDM